MAELAQVLEKRFARPLNLSVQLQPDLIGGIRVVAVSTTEAEARLWLDENHGEWDVAVLDLVLDADGSVASATLVDVTNDYFRRAAENAGERLRFSPPAAGEANVRVRLYFDMRPGRTDIRVVRRG